MGSMNPAAYGSSGSYGQTKMIASGPSGAVFGDDKLSLLTDILTTLVVVDYLMTREGLAAARKRSASRLHRKGRKKYPRPNLDQGGNDIRIYSLYPFFRQYNYFFNKNMLYSK